MDGYKEVTTAGDKPHCCTSVLAGGELFPEEVSLASLLDDADPAIPDTWDVLNDDIRIETHDAALIDSFAADVGRNLFDIVVFKCGIAVVVPDADVIPQKFMAQLDGDLVHYETPIHRLPTEEDGVRSLRNTAAWWKCHVRETYSREDQSLILRALYILSETPYLSSGNSASNTTVHATFQSNTDPLQFVGIVGADISYPIILTYVLAQEDAEKGWHNMPREFVLARIGMDSQRYCKMQPRVQSIYHKTMISDATEDA